MTIREFSIALTIFVFSFALASLFFAMMRLNRESDAVKGRWAEPLHQMFWYLALSLLALATVQIFLGSFVDWNISTLSTITGVLSAFMVREAASRGGLTIRHRAWFDVFPQGFLEERRARQSLTD